MKGSGKRLQLEDGSYVVVSRCDHDYLRQFTWRRHGRANPRSKIGLLNRVVAERKGLAIPKGWRAVRVNYRPWDFRRSNIGVYRRPSDVPRNRRKGVVYFKRTKQWRSHVMTKFRHTMYTYHKTKRAALAARVKCLNQKGW